jgi:predicted ATPase
MSTSTVTRRECGCTAVHDPHRIVLTGGPGAGKTAVLELIKRSFCSHVVVLPESAGIVFGGGFPRRPDEISLQSAQRAIFHVQRELENAAVSQNPAIILCDRGTIDGGAYWTGEPDLWTSVGSTLAAELGRYATVIHLRVPSADGGYDLSNPLRIETAAQAAVIDERIARLWASHARLFSVPPADAFIAKASRVLDILAGELPACCRSYLSPA